MIPEPELTGLTSKQANQLVAISQRYRDRVGHDAKDPAVWFSVHIGNYLSSLALQTEAECIASQKRPLITLRRSAVKLRRNTMTAFRNYLGRRPTADDLLADVRRFETVPAHIAEAISRDIARLA
jgi:hypothetical protein